MESRTEFNGTREVELPWEPGPVPEDWRHAAARILADLERELAPAPRDWISGRVITLLASYWLPDMPEKLNAAVANDWIAVLGDLPRWAIEGACRDYLASDTRARPTPGNIRTLALVRCGGKMRERDRLQACLNCKGAPAPPESRGNGVMSMADACKKFDEIKRGILDSMDPKERAVAERALKARRA